MEKMMDEGGQEETKKQEIKKKWLNGGMEEGMDHGKERVKAGMKRKEIKEKKESEEKESNESINKTFRFNFW